MADKLAALRSLIGPATDAADIMRGIAEVAQGDTALAIDLAQTLGRTDEEKTAWITTLAREWTARAPQEAWNWLGTLDATRIRDWAAGSLPEVIIGGIAKGNPPLLMQNLDALVHAGEGSLGVSPVVAAHLGLQALVENHQLDLARRAVESWALDPAKPGIGEAAYVTVAIALSQTSGNDAGAWLKAQPASPERDIALIEFPAHWAQQDSPAAMAWAETQVPPELRQKTIERTFFEWIERSPADAGEWLAGYLSRAPAGLDSDRLVAAVLNLGTPLKSNPATALQWLDLISDPRLRTASEDRVVLRWGRQDLNAATAYITSSAQIDPARRQSLLTQMQSPTYRESDN